MIFLAFALGVMLSPDTLILLGNTLGHEGSCGAQRSPHRRRPPRADGADLWATWPPPTAREGESQNLADAFGPLVATVLPLCARVVYTVGPRRASSLSLGTCLMRCSSTGSRIWDFRFAFLGWWSGSAWRGRAWPRWRSSVTWRLLWVACSPVGHGSPRVWADSARGRGDGFVLFRDHAESARGPAPLHRV